MNAHQLSNSPPSSRYELIAKIAAGGMATVYLGALRGPYGFEQLVAIKKLHAHLLDDASVRESLIHEARLASRIRHANVVDVRDIEVVDDAVQLVMTYIEGATLGTLMAEASQRETKLPTRIAIRILLDACAGLHAAHELTDSMGKPLALVHRDVSPQNILVGVDGIGRITDFGVARDESSHRLRTRTGTLKGKFAYMAPEYIRGERPDRRVDVFALAIVLWEALTGTRLFKGSNDADTISRVTMLEVPPLASKLPELGEGIDAIFDMALSKKPETRFSTAQALGLALETVAAKFDMIATAVEVGEYVREHARAHLERLEQLRIAASRSSRTNEAHSHTRTVRMASTPELSIAAQSPLSQGTREVPCPPPEEDTSVAPARYHEKVATMMSDDGQDAQNENEPQSRQDIVPTQRTPTAEDAQAAMPAVEILNAPAPSNDDGAAADPSDVPPKPVAFSGKARLSPSTHVRDFVFPKKPEEGPAAAPALGTNRRHEAKSSTMTLPVPLRNTSVAVLPFSQEKRIASRVRWAIAAILLLALSGIAVLWSFFPAAHEGSTRTEPQK